MFSFDSSPDMTVINARALENVRALVSWKRQDAGLSGKYGDPRPIRSVGIIGAGTMGAEIAAAEIKSHLPVTIFDSNPDALATIARRVSAELVAVGDMPAARASVDQLLHPAAQLADAAKCDLVIETIVETLPAKLELYRRLGGIIEAETIVTSNTSTIAIGKLAESLPKPERFCGLHFCHPVRERPLVEIVRGSKTGGDAIASLVAHAAAIDKLPIVAADAPGFIVNRLLLPYLAEALELLMEGATIETVENAALKFGMAKGPFRLMDEIGLDTTLQAGWCMAAAFPDRIPISPLLVALIKAGRLGQKTRAGFFSYIGDTNDKPRQTADVSPSEDGNSEKDGENRTVPFMPRDNRDGPRENPQADPAIIEIVARWVKYPASLSSESVVHRLIMPMILEASRIVEEGVASDPRDIDLAVIFGLGFPARRGGLLWWADAIKPATVIEMIRPLEPIGPRWRSTKILLDMADRGGRFYN